MCYVQEIIHRREQEIGKLTDELEKSHGVEDSTIQNEINESIILQLNTEVHTTDGEFFGNSIRGLDATARSSCARESETAAALERARHRTDRGASPQESRAGPGRRRASSR